MGRHFRLADTDWTAERDFGEHEGARPRFQFDDDFGPVRPASWSPASLTLTDGGTTISAVLPSNSGNDVINGANNPNGVVLAGGGGADVITGGNGPDTIYGFGAQDTSPNAGAIEVARLSSGLASPVFGTFAPGVADTMFVIEQHTGKIQLVNLLTGAVSATPFLDIPNSQLAGGGEQGLLGMAFSPDYATNGKFYLYLTNAQGDIEVREYTRSAANPLVANTTFKLILTIDHPPETNHNGGWLGFGPDGMLYIATGDGGGGGDVNNHAQDLNSYLGKMLRIDVSSDGFPADPNKNYAIPHDNPFVGVNGLDEIWAYGLRNPWRCSFDPVTGHLIIADVGQGAQEEVDFVPAGTPGGINFGWHVMEGTAIYDDTTPGNPPANDPSLWDPTFTYGHNSTDGGFAITGGYMVYLSGDGNPLYVFADYVSGHFWTASIDADGHLYDVAIRDAELIQHGSGTFDQIVSFAYDHASNRLYAIGLDGEIWAISMQAGAADRGDTINGGDGNDTIYGGGGFDTLNGENGNDRVYGGIGNDSLLGGEGNDTLDGGLGNDILNGGNGSDWADYRNAGAVGVTVSLAITTAQDTLGQGIDTLIGIEKLRGSLAADSLTGSAGADTLDGDAGNDVLSGGAGGDILIGGAGADALNGGADLDYASYVSSAAGVTLNLTTGVHLGDAAGDTFVSIERFRLSDHDDSFTGSAATDYAYGSFGADTLSGAGGIDRLYGEEDNDALHGDAGNDILIGGLGADVLDGGADRDTASYETALGAVSLNFTSGIHTGDAAGDSFTSIEIFLLSAFADSFTGGGADEEVRGGDGNDTLSGAGGIDTLRGENGADTLNGDDGDDLLNGGAGADALHGGNGTDTAVYLLATAGVSINLTSGVNTGEAAGDTFDSIEHFQLSNGFTLADSFTGSSGADWVAGYKGVDTLNGMGGNDTLNGGEHNDVLNGGAGADKLIGGTGDDAMTGGSEADQFWLNAPGSGHDTVSDFENGVDHIRITGVSGVTSFANLTISTNGSGWAVITLPDGSNITLTGVTAAQVDASDFLFA